MKYESKLVYLLEANGATEEDCKEADKKLRELLYRSGIYRGDSLYPDLLLLSLLKKERVIPSELWEKSCSLELKGLIARSVYSRGEHRGAITLKGLRSLGRNYIKMKLADQKEFDNAVAYLNSKMHH